MSIRTAGTGEDEPFIRYRRFLLQKPRIGFRAYVQKSGKGEAEAFTRGRAYKTTREESHDRPRRDPSPGYDE